MTPSREQRVAELEHRLEILGEDGGRTLAWFIPALRRVLEVEVAAAYGVKVVEGRLGVDFYDQSGASVRSQKAVDIYDRWFRTQEGRVSGFDPRAPAPSGRNRLVTVPVSSSWMLRHGVPPPLRRTISAPTEEGVELVLRPTGFDMPTSRILVCEGPSLLAYVGAFDTSGFRHGQPAVLTRLVAPLVRRLRLERRLEEANIHALGIEAALEHLPMAAFVVSRRGRILAGNRIGRACIEGDRAIHSALTSINGPDPSIFDVTPLATGTTTHHLAVRRCHDPRAEPKLAAKARLWSLTRRETEVARWILRGTTNHAIAAELGCSVKTIEHHVSSILRKGGLENRASMIVAVHEG